ncbi:MAG: polysaccharide deacetylase family protein [Propionibacteriaceae bacterium]|nr:polysaccharide deacetylase family protein [Propionibacteriaceae bacterium]
MKKLVGVLLAASLLLTGCGSPNPDPGGTADEQAGAAPAPQTQDPPGDARSEKTSQEPSQEITPEPPANQAANPEPPSTPVQAQTNAEAPQGVDPNQGPAVDCKVEKCIALTIDDGPPPETAEVLDLFKEKGVKATFFLLGSLAKERPELVKRIYDEGHVIGNHSWDHADMNTLSTAKIKQELERTNEVIAKATGVVPSLARPPYGNKPKAYIKQVKKDGQAIIMWTIDPEDWKTRSKTQNIKRIVGAAKRNSIILTHDIWPSTRAAYSSIIDKLQAKGFTFVTIPELYGNKLKAGKVYGW